MSYIGLLIIAIGAFCQSSSYVPINKVKQWNWESFWLVQGIFAWIVFPLLGALLSTPGDQSLISLYMSNPAASMKAMFFGMLWGIGGLTFGLSMRYLGVALGQSIALGTCASLGTILTPIFTGSKGDLTASIWLGVAVTFIGIIIIGLAGMMKNKGVNDSEKKESVKDFNIGKGLGVALLSGFMSSCFAIGLGFGEPLHFEGSSDLFKSLPATLLVTLGGFVSNACYCLEQNHRNKTWSDYRKTSVWTNNLIFCALAGILWYSQFFGLSLGKSFMQNSPVLLSLSWCILMALDVLFSNVWGVVLKEWKGCSRKTISVLALGLGILILSVFFPQFF